MIKRLAGNWLVVLLLLMVLALGVVAAGRLTATAVQAAQPAAVTALCTPMDVGVFDQRVHLRCSNVTVVGVNNVYWWAYPTSDSAGASRFLSLFETARATGQNVTIYYTAGDLSGSAFGCNNGDCRRIWGATSP